MKKLFTILALILFSILVNAQIRYTLLSEHYEDETSLIRIRIDEPINQDINGGYGYKIKTPIDFTSFAIGWLANTTNYEAGEFYLVFRVHKPGKGWTQWKTDDGFISPEETATNTYFSDLLFGMDELLHDSIEFYIHTPEGETLTEIQLVLQDISKTVNLDQIINTELGGAKACPEFPAIVPRSEWCGSYDACQNPTYTVTYRTPTHTVVHHGASPDSYTDGYAIVRSYWNYHVNTNGWADIGYNYLFDKYGNFFQGRYNPNLPNQDVNGAHAGSANPYSIGLNFLGNSDAVNTAPTTPQLQKCSEFLAWWFDYKSFDPLSSASVVNQLGNTVTLPRICGHKDINPGGTTCPGNALYALIPSIKTSTNQIILDCTTPTDVEPPTTSITTDRTWYNSDFNAAFSDEDNAGGTGVNTSFYQIMDYNGTEWRANAANGFFNDNFTTAIHSDWTNISGTWSINANHLLQSNEVSTNTNIYANVTQESDGIYLYHWQQKISGAGSIKRSGMYFFCSDPTQIARDDSYMVYLRADGNTVEIYKYINNSYSAGGGYYITEPYTIDPNIWYDVKVILNNSTGEISVYIDNNLAATTTDPTPLTSGIAISPRTGECQTEYDDIKVYKSRASNVVVSVGELGNNDIRYQSPTTTQEAGRIRTILVDNANNWSESISKNIFVDRVIPTTSASVTNEWQTQDFTTNFTDIDALSGIEKRFYQVIDYSGTKWSANTEKGFAYNTFDTEIGSEWTSSVGTWNITSNNLVQSDESQSNTNIYSYLKQDLSNRYLYEYNMKIEGSGTNRRAGFHYFCDQPSLINRGNSYFVWFRLASQELEFYKVTDDVFSLEKYYDINIVAGQWYNIKITYDRITGNTMVYMDNALVGEYLDPQPYTAGNYISFRSGNSKLSVNNLKVYRTRTTSATVSLGDATKDIRYQNTSPASIAARVNSIATDSAKNVSAIFTKDLKVDWTNPLTISSINDGTAVDVDVTNNLNQIAANWSASSDPNSGIVKYYYAVGTTVGGTNLINWTDVGLNLSFTNNSVSLVNGQMYYTSVKAQNGAGLQSTVANSDGVLAIVLDCPENMSICVSNPSFALSGATPLGGNYSGIGVTGNQFYPSTAGDGTHTITYTYSTEICQFQIDVNPLPVLSCSEDIYIADNGAQFTLNGSTPIGGIYTINGNPVTTFNPSDYGIGTFGVNYSYTDSPNNCENSCSFNIFVYEPTSVNCPQDLSVCADAADISLAGATPPGGMYSGDGVTDGIFSPSIAGLGVHTITYTFETVSCDFTISVDALPEVTCPQNLTVTTDDAEFPLSGALPTEGQYLYNSEQIINFDPNAFGVGEYTISYVYADPISGCLAQCDFNITVELGVSLTELNQNEIQIYPNPNDGNFVIDFGQLDGDFAFEIFDINGRIIQKNNSQQISYDFDKSVSFKLESGMYFIKVTGRNGIITKKIIVK